MIEARKTSFFGRMVAYVRVVWWVIKAIYTLEALCVGGAKVSNGLDMCVTRE